MRKPRKEYAYVAYRIDPAYGQNLGDFAIRREIRPMAYGGSWWKTYHYASDEYNGPHGAFRQGRIVNRSSLTHIDWGSRIYNECIRAVERLLKEEQGDV